jgi:hypothetical protein
MGKTKTARFTAVVQKAGRPQTFVLWQDPKKDPSFQSALQQERVMTVMREPKGKEYGLAGFKRSKAATYHIFPKKLAAFEGKRIVGIKYEELAPTRPIGKPVKEEESKPEAKPRAVAAQPRTRQYEVTLRVTAVINESFLVDAGSNAEAKRAAQAASAEKTPDISKAKLTRRVAKVRKAGARAEQ